MFLTLHPISCPYFAEGVVSPAVNAGNEGRLSMFRIAAPRLSYAVTLMVLMLFGVGALDLKKYCNMNNWNSSRLLICLLVCMLMPFGLYAQHGVKVKKDARRSSGDVVTADLVLGDKTYKDVLKFTENGDGDLVFVGITYPKPDAADLDDIEERYQHQAIPAATPDFGEDGFYFKYNGVYDGYLDFVDALLTPERALSHSVLVDFLNGTCKSENGSSIYCAFARPSGYGPEIVNYTNGGYNGNTTSWPINNTWNGESYSQTRTIDEGDLYWKDVSTSWIMDAYYYQDEYPYQESLYAPGTYTNSFGQRILCYQWTLDNGGYVIFKKYIPSQYMTPITRNEFMTRYWESVNAQNHRKAYRAWRADKVAAFQTALASCNEIIIPSSVGGKTVKDINWSYSPFTINATSLKLPNTIETITRVPSDEYLPALTTVNLKNLASLKYIRSYAFSDCNSLVIDTLVLPDSPNNYIAIGRNAFSGVTINWLHEKELYYYYADADYISSEDKYYLHKLSGLKNSNIYLDHSVYGVHFYLDYNEVGDEKVFYTDPTNKIYVPALQLNAYKQADGWKDIKDQIYPWPENRYVLIDDEIDYAVAYTDDATTHTTKLTYVGTKTGKKLEIPGSFDDGYTVVAVTGCQSGVWEEVVLPSSVDSLYLSAFASCPNLKKINIENVKKIDGSAIFASCIKLESVTNSYLTTLGGGFFSDCSALTNVSFSSVETIAGGVFGGCTALKNVSLPALTSLPGGTFSSCSNLETLNLASVVEIPASSFSGKQKLESVVLGAVVNIGDAAFSGCTSLTSVTTPDAGVVLAFPSTLRTIGNAAFQKCPLAGVLDFATTSSNLQKIGAGAFSESEITYLTLPGSLRTAAGDIVETGGNVDFSQSTFAIGNGAFSKNYNLKTVRIDEGVNGIGNQAFKFCPNLTSIRLPGTLLYIGSHFLCGAKLMPDLKIPESVTDINGAFLMGCDSLRKVYLYCSPEALKRTSLAGDECFSPVDLMRANDEWVAAHFEGDYKCKHVNNCQFFVTSQEMYHAYIDYQNLDGIYPWLRLDRFDLNYNLCGSNNDGSLTSDGINWKAKDYYNNHFNDFPINTGINGQTYSGAWEGAWTAYGPINQAPRRAAYYSRLTNELQTTYWEQFEKTGYHNRFNWFPPSDEEGITGDKHGTPDYIHPWRTICFPFKPVKSELDELIGAEAVLAEYVSAHLASKSEENGETLYHYNLTFRTIDHGDIVPDQPYLLRPYKPDVDTVKIPMYSADPIALYNNQSAKMTDEHWTVDIRDVEAVDNDPGTDIHMIGTYVPYKLSQAEFYLKNWFDETNKVYSMNFYKASTDNTVTVNEFKCFFRIVKNGVPIKKARLGTTFYVEDENGNTTSIAESDILDYQDGSYAMTPVYNLSGQRVANRLEGTNLPEGVYIVNGRKVVVKANK